MAMFDADAVDDVFNEVQADIDEWAEEIMALFVSGPIDRGADTMWNGQEESVKDLHRQRNPESAELLDGLRKGAPNGSR